MARETVAQRNARLAQEREERLEAERLAYPLRLMNLLERVSNLSNFELSVKNGMFFVHDRDGGRSADDHELAYSWSEHNQAVLENLTWKVEAAEQELAEAQRRAEVYRAAKQKAAELFTDEERELLGL